MVVLSEAVIVDHYSDDLIVSQIIGVTIVSPNVCSGADQRKHQNSASLAFVRGIDRRILYTKGQ